MEKKFQINLADCIVGPDELDLLLKEWRKDPQPKNMNKLARMYLAHQWKLQTDFLPYDSRKRYKEGDRILVRVRSMDRPEDRPELQPAEVIAVSIGGYTKDGFVGDKITLRLLYQEAKLSRRDIKEYIANYQGEERFDSAEVIPHVIREKDEEEVIPKILMAISDDKSFVEFEGKWLPKELLIDVSGKMNKVEKIIAESKQALSTDVILEKVQAIDKEEELNQCLEFSLNYFLSKDKRFIFVQDSGKKWKLSKAHKPDSVKGYEKREWTITVQEEWLEKGIFIVPRKLGENMVSTNEVYVLYDQIEEILPYKENKRVIEKFHKFYSVKAIADGDKVHLQLQGLEPTKLFVSSRWQRRLERLIRLEPVDLHWEQSSLRDCIIVVLAKFKEPAHYREIYSEIAAHKDISLGAIIGTLSRYCPSLFVHAGSSQWWLGGLAVQKVISKHGQSDSPETIAINDEIWKAVAFIEDNDYIYKLLQRTLRSLSFDEICRRLADYLGVDVNGLRATGFLKADDQRLRRLDDGTWALEEWFRREDKVPIKKTPLEKPPKSGLFWLLAIIVIILLLTGTASVLIWIFIYGR